MIERQRDREIEIRYTELDVRCARRSGLRETEKENNVSARK